ncbi:MAG: DUF898 family protein [Hyphomicrobiales bacterium]|nr:DUF898 family protein [Hyphomicrobiales bacterium]
MTMNDTSVPVSGESSIKFDGKPRDFFNLLWRGSWLSLVTLGVYRFWMITQLRQHLWAHSGVGRDKVEYTGRGIELFFGFLLAIAILWPIYILLFVLNLLIVKEENGDIRHYYNVIQSIVEIVLLVMFYFFGQFAIFKARRYRLTRTLWRGVRFWMSGSAWRYMLLALAWDIAVGLTLGLAHPWREAALERYKMSNTLYGDLRGDFVARPWDFFKRGLWIWIVAVIPFALGLILIGESVAEKHLHPDSKAPGFAQGVLGILILLGLALSPFLYAAYKRIEMVWWINGLRIGEVRFSADREKIRFAGLYWAALGSYFLTLFVFGIILGLGVAFFKGLPLALTPAAGGGHGGLPVLVGGGLMVLLYGTMLVAMAIVYRWFLQRGYWSIVANAARVENLGAADHVTAMGSPSSALGEGLAAMLDVSGF